MDRTSSLQVSAHRMPQAQQHQLGLILSKHLSSLCTVDAEQLMTRLSSTSHTMRQACDIGGLASRSRDRARIYSGSSELHYNFLFESEDITLASGVRHHCSQKIMSGGCDHILASLVSEDFPAQVQDLALARAKVRLHGNTEHLHWVAYLLSSLPHHDKSHSQKLLVNQCMSSLKACIDGQASILDLQKPLELLAAHEESSQHIQSAFLARVSEDIQRGQLDHLLNTNAFTLPPFGSTSRQAETTRLRHLILQGTFDQQIRHEGTSLFDNSAAFIGPLLARLRSRLEAMSLIKLCGIKCEQMTQTHRPEYRQTMSAIEAQEAKLIHSTPSLRLLLDLRYTDIYGHLSTANAELVNTKIQRWLKDATDGQVVFRAEQEWRSSSHVNTAQSQFSLTLSNMIQAELLNRIPTITNIENLEQIVPNRDFCPEIFKASKTRMVDIIQAGFADYKLDTLLDLYEGHLDVANAISARYTLYVTELDLNAWVNSGGDTLRSYKQALANTIQRKNDFELIADQMAKQTSSASPYYWASQTVPLIRIQDFSAERLNLALTQFSAALASIEEPLPALDDTYCFFSMNNTISAQFTTWLAENNHAEAVALLLSEERFSSHTIDKWALADLAVQHDQLEVFQVLVTDEQRMLERHLDKACEYNSLKVLDFLCHSQTRNMPENEHQDILDSAVHTAARHGHLEALHILSAAGACTNETNKKNLVSYPACAPIWTAAYAKQDACVLELAKQGHELNSAHRGTSLVNFYLARGKLSVVKVLLGLGAEPTKKLRLLHPKLVKQTG